MFKNSMLKSIFVLTLSIAFLPQSCFVQEIIDSKSVEHLFFFPMTRQSNEYTCGAASAIALLAFYGESELEIDAGKELGTNPSYGTDYRQMVKFFQSRGYKVIAHEGMTIEELKCYIDQKLPVLVLLQAWEMNIKDYTNYWGIGHFAIVIGYDQEKIYFMDPWMLGNYGFIPIKEFLNRWHQLTFDKIYLKQWGMVITEHPIKSYNPDQIYYIP